MIKKIKKKKRFEKNKEKKKIIRINIKIITKYLAWRNWNNTINLTLIYLALKKKGKKKEDKR